MPKRSAQTAQEKYDRYAKKMRRLEKQMKKRPRVISSDEEDDAHEVLPASDQPTTSATDEVAVLEPPTEPPTMTDQPTVLSGDTPTTAAAAATPPPADHQPSDTIDPDLLLALGTCEPEDQEFGEPIHDSLSKIWLPILKKGLDKEAKDKLVKQYLVPNNCKLLQAPRLNAEISAAISEVVRGRDKKLMSFQQQLGTGLAAYSRALHTLVVTKDITQATRYASDGGRILADLHSLFTKDRIKLVTPSLEKNMAHVMQDSERDDFLFGNTLSEKIKASKAIEKQGQQIKKPAPKPIASQVSTVNNRPHNQGNWSGPPRYPSNRGGRGAARRPGPPPPPSRRPYTASKTNNLPKTPRANQ